MEANKLQEIIEKIQKFTKSKVTMDSAFEDLKIDSLSLAEIVFDLEDKYGVTVADEDLMKIKKVKDIEEVFDKTLGK
ncbi:phosphopantetheine-binding protein [Mycoplasma tauri]|uniref:phosphopantetheine-binding protein n=1 Tax=Mycoplasma tauri TaxID=547987 RepID=UPI0019681B8F|nr:phosphopantetheine-binding protein [Mycoplasma tauri]MBZ4203422.1 acyl carrier protein [Mycoplasma tauri]MBZ4204029.1 acyl carrier protein [Mycoplasma tauri]MBZ4212754.1 acyl carrier protein [Mycoplasma tauri]MBZ4217977.1 acyl carrier protein [Mycoplasma tauri]MBZ4226542.1 acyl carrier protein [Mycoplasma tauri]